MSEFTLPAPLNIEPKCKECMDRAEEAMQYYESVWKKRNAEIRNKTIEEVKERMQNEISFTRIQKQLMIYILDKMKGEQDGIR